MKLRRKQKVSVFDKTLAEMRDAFNTKSKRELQYELDLKMDKQWRNEEEKIINTPLLHLDDPDHAKPVTRRDFLSRGLIATTATVLVPGIPSMLYGQTTCPAATTGLNHIPFSRSMHRAECKWRAPISVAAVSTIRTISCRAIRPSAFRPT
jgi:hypothetical protein